MIFANPSTATVNFNNTIANAGAGDLVNATAGSVVALNASASTLTGAIQTDATSTTNVSLANGTTWNMTASSTATSLNVANSAVVFSAPSAGGFKTLTVGSYFGTGASLSLNTMLGGSSSPTDQLIVKGGSATGLTALTIKNAGGAGALTTGAGIPVVVAANGGTTAPSAFSLANTPVVGGFEYSLGRDSANQDWYLTSKPASTLGRYSKLGHGARQIAVRSNGHRAIARARCSLAPTSRSTAAVAAAASARSALLASARMGDGASAIA